MHSPQQKSKNVFLVVGVYIKLKQPLQCQFNKEFAFLLLLMTGSRCTQVFLISHCHIFIYKRTSTCPVEIFETQYLNGSESNASPAVSLPDSH